MARFKGALEQIDEELSRSYEPNPQRKAQLYQDLSESFQTLTVNLNANDPEHLDYLEFTLLNASLVAARVAASPYWGRIGKRFGNRRALQVAATVIVPLPALWLFGDGFLYLLALQVLAGFAWAGFDLMTVLNLFDCSSPAERSRALAAFNLINGVAIVLGTLLGGLAFLALGDAAYAPVFLASSVLRGVTSLAFGRGAGLRRDDEHSFGAVLLRVMSLRPGLGPRLRPIAIRRPRTRRRRPPPGPRDGHI